MKENKILELGEQYFSCFVSKDLTSLKRLFSPKIKLFDPIIRNIEGIDNVLLANEKIFSSSEEIKINQKKLFVDYFSKILVAELEICFDLNILNVVDIIEFDSSGKIISIVAYFDSRQIRVN
jgi:hypothetical protein